MKEKKEIVISLAELIPIVLTTLFLGIIGGLLVSYLVFIKSVDPKTNEFLRTYNELKGKYYEEVNEDELFAAGIKGMVEYFEDKNTDFLDKKESSMLSNNLNGAYVGYGINLEKKSDGFYITEAYEEAMKEFLNIRLPVKIKTINDQDINHLNVEELMSLLTPTSKINIEFDDDTSIMLNKQKIEYKSVTYNKLEDDLYYLRIALFSDNTYSQLVEAKDVLNSSRIILDLRNNVGGLLQSVKNISSLFSSKEEVIFKTKFRDEVEDYNTNGLGKDYKLVVLVNEKTASAAEVLASYLQEQKGAILVGTATYGKGTIQETKKLNSGASIKFTTKEWLTSKGLSINNKGIIPQFIEYDPYEQNVVAVKQIKELV